MAARLNPPQLQLTLYVISTIQQPYSVLMIDVKETGAFDRRANIPQAVQSLSQSRRITTPRRVEGVEPAQLSEAEGGLHVGQAEVVTQQLVAIPLDLAVAPQEPSPPGHAVIVGRNHASLTRCDVLGRVERE